MKTIFNLLFLKRITFVSGFIVVINCQSFAQIFTTSAAATGSITIKPRGINGILNNPVDFSSTNTALGEQALSSGFNVTDNTIIGYKSFVNTGTIYPNPYNGNGNTGVGAWALYNNHQGYDNTIFGESSMFSNFGSTGYENSTFGRAAMVFNTTGIDNAAFGTSSLYDVTTGSNNSAFGAYALVSTETSNHQSAFGWNTLFYHRIGDDNSAFGLEAMFYDTSGTNNAAFGHLAMLHNLSGSANAAFGIYALGFNTTGAANSVFGYASMNINDIGQGNVGMGAQSLAHVNASSNVALGTTALYSDSTGSRNVAVGFSAGYYELSSNKLYIDYASVPFNSNTTLIGGDFSAKKVCIFCNLSATGDNAFTTRNEAFQVQGNAMKTAGSGNWMFSSDRRLKTNIVPLNRQEILQKLLQTQGVNYTLIAHPEEGIQYGFIAQDLRKIFPTKVYETKSGFLSASYGGFVPIFVEALRAINEKVETLEKNQTDVKALTARLEKMEALGKELSLK